jgi:hypothetical protein
MCDVKGTGTVTKADMHNMDWLISESTGHPTILSTTERAEAVRGDAWRGAGIGVTVGEFVYAKLEDMKARQPWWVDLAELYNTASDELRAGRCFPLFLRFSIGKCRNCPFFRGFESEMKGKPGQRFT